MTLRSILRGLLVLSLLVWLLALWGAVASSDQNLRRLDPPGIERLAALSLWALLLLPLFSASALWRLGRSAAPDTPAGRRPLRDPLSKSAWAAVWVYAALLAFSCAARLTHGRASMTWARGNMTYRAGVEPQVRLPGASSGCPGSVNYHFLCFFVDVMPVIGCL